ncbi:uncharacterized protein METZ01_LOCUS413062 [marine metagenome]|uniref:Uncharacterized protein n=1 Tax=marine metagenome TaxID=408172 RepID=A0A382WPZ8_9ZZZZ
MSRNKSSIYVADLSKKGLFLGVI